MLQTCIKVFGFKYKKKWLGNFGTDSPFYVFKVFPPFQIDVIKNIVIFKLNKFLIYLIFLVIVPLTIVI